jgi:O-antigen/teichoic acid export membrane protein
LRSSRERLLLGRQTERRILPEGTTLLIDNQEIGQGAPGPLKPLPSSRKLALGAIASGAVNIFKVGLQLLLLPIMARLLGPNEFGVYALALPTVSFVALLADGGLGATLAREPETSSLVWSSAFWFLFCTGIVLAVAASIFGVLLSHLVQQPRISPMIALLSLSLVFLALSVPAGARLARRRNLQAGAVAELTANLIGAVVAITMAAHGAGAWSLVAQYLTIYAVRALVLNFVAFERPGYEFSIGSIRPHVASGGLLIGTRFSEYLGRVGENVLIDRILGTPVLGSFTFANQVSRFASETVGNVSWAALYVQALTSERTSVVDLHRRFCRLLAGVLFPTTFLAAAAAPELTDMLLGPKWAELPLMLRVFLPLSAMSIIAVQVGPILLASDRFKLYFRCATVLALGRVIVVCTGIWFGLEGVVFGFAAVTMLHFVILTVLSEPLTGCRVAPMLRGLVGPALSSIVAVLACQMVLRSFPAGDATTIVSLSVGLAAFSVCMLLIDRQGLAEDWRIVRRLIKPI